jgi:hypothetical protein
MAGHLTRGGFPPNATVSVYPAATGTSGSLATLYTDKTAGTSINQSTAPVAADGNGYLSTYALPGDYITSYASPASFINPSEIITVEEHPNFTNVQQNLTPSVTGALVIDASLGSIAKVSPTANMTSTVTNLQAGQRFVLAFVSDGTHTLGYPTAPVPKWVGASAPTPSATSGYEDILVFLYDGTNLREISRALGLH